MWVLAYGELQAAHMVKSKIWKRAERERVTKVFANHVKHTRFHAREEQSLWVKFVIKELCGK